jgi:flagellar biosynthesis/type III secretory pathway chaperone
MEQREAIEYYLERKMGILEKIAANTETQRRFIPRRELRGLRRVLREREALLQELAALNREIAGSLKWKTVNTLTPQFQAIAARQREIMNHAAQALQEAAMERNRIAAELNGSKKTRSIRNQYVNHWTVLAPGCRINEKG